MVKKRRKWERQVDPTESTVLHLHSQFEQLSFILYEHMSLYCCTLCQYVYHHSNDHDHHHHNHQRRHPLLNSILQVRNEATAAGAAPARESIWHYFVNKCANNLHVVLAMSPVGDTLRTRCRNFPGMSLFSYSTFHHLMTS